MSKGLSVTGVDVFTAFGVGIFGTLGTFRIVGAVVLMMYSSPYKMLGNQNFSQ
jgi:hypothetical protein